MESHRPRSRRSSEPGVAGSIVNSNHIPGAAHRSVGGVNLPVKLLPNPKLTPDRMRITSRVNRDGWFSRVTSIMDLSDTASLPTCWLVSCKYLVGVVILTVVAYPHRIGIPRRVQDDVRLSQHATPVVLSYLDTGSPPSARGHTRGVHVGMGAMVSVQPDGRPIARWIEGDLRCHGSVGNVVDLSRLAPRPPLRTLQQVEVGPATAGVADGNVGVTGSVHG